jgi:hypothetical protein
MIDADVKTVFSTDKTSGYVLMSVKATLDIIRILLEEVHPSQILKGAKDKYETITKQVGVSVIENDVVHKCVELQKENKRLGDRLDSIKNRMMEVL